MFALRPALAKHSKSLSIVNLMSVGVDQARLIIYRDL